MKTEFELKKASMAFQLKSGELLLISDEDINQIANELVIQMMVNKRNNVFLHKNTVVEKCNLLYKIVIEQKDKMTDEIRQSYFAAILELLKGNETELVPLKDHLEKIMTKEDDNP